MKKLLILLTILAIFNFVQSQKLTCEEAKRELAIINTETKKIKQAKKTIENYKRVNKKIAQLEKEKKALFKKIKQAEQAGYLAEINQEIFAQTPTAIIHAHKQAKERVKKFCKQNSITQNECKSCEVCKDKILKCHDECWKKFGKENINAELKRSCLKKCNILCDKDCKEVMEQVQACVKKQMAKQGPKLLKKLCDNPEINKNCCQNNLDSEACDTTLAKTNLIQPVEQKKLFKAGFKTGFELTKKCCKETCPKNIGACWFNRRAKK